MERPIQRLLRAIRAVRGCAGGVGKLTPDGDDWAVLNKEVDGSLSVVGTCLGVRFIPEMPLSSMKAPIPATVSAASPLAFGNVPESPMSANAGNA